MLRRILRASLASLLAVAAAAQDAAALALREQQFGQRMVAALHTLADAFAAQKQHARAYALRRELLLEYAADDEKARDKCGFTKVGDQWRADAGKLVLDKDLTGDPKVMKKLEPQLAALRKEQAKEHRALAEGFAKAGDAAASARHWRRIAELVPGDKGAAEALATQKFGGFVGTADELAMLRRAWAIRGAVQWLSQKEFPLETVAAPEPLLAAAGLQHTVVGSEHFVVAGALPEAQLRHVAQYVERTYLLCHLLVGTSEGDVLRPVRRRDLVFVDGDAAYHAVLDRCADQFDAARLQFLKHDVDLAFVRSGERDVRLVKTNGGNEEAQDQAVRGVVQDVLGLRTDGLWEGIGHAVCGFFFGRTLTFLVEQRDEKTVASFTQKLLAPDMEVWREIAEQSAWARSDSRTSEIVLIHASKFTTEQRVKAWAICDYLWHWRPELLRTLDGCRGEEVRTPPDVEREFLARAGVELPAIDRDWREFWAKKRELRAAMAADPLGGEKDKDRARRTEARALVAAVNDLRVAALRGPVGFYFAEGPDTQAALAYGEALRKAEAERQKAERQKKPTAGIALPPLPAAVGRTVLWARGEPAAGAQQGDKQGTQQGTQQIVQQIEQQWWARPAWRDALLHPGRMLLGANRTPTSLCVDLSEPALPTRHGLPLCWPRAGQKDVPGAAVVEHLGPHLTAALRAAGRPAEGPVGMPLSLHFAREVPAADLAAIRCEVFRGGVRVDGLLVVCQGGDASGDSAPGCVAYVPFEPLPHGAEVEFQWVLPAALLGGAESPAAATFAVRGP